VYRSGVHVGVRIAILVYTLSIPCTLKLLRVTGGVKEKMYYNTVFMKPEYKSECK